jgi:hypothetical protein
LNISNISTKDASKEIQNFVVTIFDHYRNAIMYMEGLAELTEEILKEQKRLWDHTDILSDLRNRESGAKGRVRKFLETIDNLDSSFFSAFHSERLIKTDARNSHSFASHRFQYDGGFLHRRTKTSLLQDDAS